MADVADLPYAPVGSVIARLGLAPSPVENLVDRAAERAVLGALFLDGAADGCVVKVRTILPDPRAFGDVRHVSIYEAILAVVARGEAITYATVGHALRAADRLNAVGGLPYLAEMTDEVLGLTWVESHARLVAEMHARRVLRSYGDALSRRAVDLSRPVAEIRDGAAKAIREVTIPGATPVTLGSDLEAMWRRVEEVASGAVAPLLATGLAPLDRVLDGGFAPGKVYLLAARPRVGKTALAMQVALNVARAGGAVYVASLEIPAADLVRQSVACLASVDHTRIAKATLTDDEASRAVRASNELARLPIYRVDPTTPGCPRTVAALGAAVAALPAAPSLIILDHVGKLRSLTRHRERRDAIAEVSEGLCDLAKQTGAAVLALAHINRDGAERPTLEHLADADALGKDADGVLLMHRDDLYPPRRRDAAPPEPGVGLVLAAKVRGAPVNALCKLRLRGEFQRWDPVEADAPDADRYDGRAWNDWEAAE